MSEIKRKKWPANAQELERQAASLTEEEKDILGAGEEREQQQIVHCKKVGVLNAFLCDIFDGPLTKNFFGPPTDYDN